METTEVKPSRKMQTGASGTSRILILFHIYYVDVAETIINDYRHLFNVGKTVVTTTTNNTTAVAVLLKKYGIDTRILTTENKGYDIYPFLEAASQLDIEQFDLILKLHTKKGLAGLEDHYRKAGLAWLRLLLDSIAGTAEIVDRVIEYFSTHEDVAMIGSADMYKSARALMHGNEVFVAELLQQIAKNRDMRVDWGFFAGTIVWLRPALLEPLSKIKKLISSEKNGEMKSGMKQSMWHGLERLLGLLPELCGMQTALAYYKDSHEQETCIIKAGERNSPHGSAYGPSYTIGNYLRRKENYNTLHNKSYIDTNFYLKTYQEIGVNDLEPVYHYARYGPFEGKNPCPEFSSSWYWEANKKVLRQHCNPYLHWREVGMKTGCVSFPAQENYALMARLILDSGLFNARQYKENNPKIKISTELSAAQHYCKHGWRDRQYPCSTALFDPIWYEETYLRNWKTPINPLIHFLQSKDKGLVDPRPQVSGTMQLRPGTILRKESRRICLFAGYDPDSIIDDYVLEYLKELSQYADIYYLADCHLSDTELAKIRPYTKRAWAFRHGEYDFGSYLRLALDLVGWKKICAYDELLLVNDSAYLIQPLAAVFEKMRRVSCDWWGLQATKGTFHTKGAPSNAFKEPIPFQTVIEKRLAQYEEDDPYDFHLGAYFLAFRASTFKQGGPLHSLLSGVRKEGRKRSIIYAYEIGLTRHLLLSGFRPASYIDFVYPLHPVYTRHIFSLITSGFPLLKRVLIVKNHYRETLLRSWKAELAKAVDGIDTGAIEKNIKRLAPAKTLYYSLAIPQGTTKWPIRPMTPEALNKADMNSSPHVNVWSFVLSLECNKPKPRLKQMIGITKKLTRISPVILTRGWAYSIDLELDDIHPTDIYPIESHEGQSALLASAFIFVEAAEDLNADLPISYQKHRVIDLAKCTRLNGHEVDKS